MPVSSVQSREISLGNISAPALRHSFWCELREASNAGAVTGSRRRGMLAFRDQALADEASVCALAVILSTLAQAPQTIRPRTASCTSPPHGAPNTPCSVNRTRPRTDTRYLPPIRDHSPDRLNSARIPPRRDEMPVEHHAIAGRKQRSSCRLLVQSSLRADRISAGAGLRTQLASLSVCNGGPPGPTPANPDKPTMRSFPTLGTIGKSAEWPFDFPIDSAILYKSRLRLSTPVHRLAFRFAARP